MRRRDGGTPPAATDAPAADSGTAAGRFAAMRASAAWAVRLAWATHPPLFAAVVGLVLARSLLPAALAVTARGLINAAVRAVHHGTTEIGVLIPWLAVGLSCPASRAPA